MSHRLNSREGPGVLMLHAGSSSGHSPILAHTPSVQRQERLPQAVETGQHNFQGKYTSLCQNTELLFIHLALL